MEFDSIEAAIAALRKGLPVLIFDSEKRENEIDLVYHASRVDSDVIYELRVAAGGLICYAMPLAIGRKLGLKLATEYFSCFEELRPLTTRRLGYGDEPAFSIWVNHKDVRTGISDSDRALTIRELHKVVVMVMKSEEIEAKRYFQENFVVPGHIPILLGRRISLRRGHTELSLHLAALAGLEPSIVLAEMLSRGRSATLEEAHRYAKERGYPLISSEQIVLEVSRYGEDLCRRYYLC